jgi:acyl-CoA reductase-like NAD-dependent aldehyde dehydrogenase
VYPIGAICTVLGERLLQARGDMLYKLAGLVEASADELAQLETLDMGKPLVGARTADVPYAARVLRHFAGCGHAVPGRERQL